MSPAQTLHDMAIPGPEGIAAELARALLDVEGDALEALLDLASRTRQAYKGNEIRFCSITNAKSGRCPEACAFCSQSAHYDTEAPVYPLCGVLARASPATTSRWCRTSCASPKASAAATCPSPPPS